MDPSNRILLAADLGDVGSVSHLEIPTQGPGEANLLVFINGITLSGQDVDSENPDPLEMIIETDYKLRDNDVLINSSAYACLASFGADDDRTLEVALDDVAVIRRTSNVIALRVTGQLVGDTTLFRVAYQVNLLLSRTN